MHKLPAHVLGRVPAWLRRPPPTRPPEARPRRTPYSGRFGMRRLACRGGPRLDPRGERAAQPEDVRAERLPEDLEGSAWPGSRCRGRGGRCRPADEAEPADGVRRGEAGAPGARSWPTHDQADTDNSCPVRYTTTVPTQALGLLNGEFSERDGRRVRRPPPEGDAPGDVPAQVDAGDPPHHRPRPRRPPRSAKDAAFVDRVAGEARPRRAEPPSTRYCLLLLNTNEFAYLD